MADFIKDVRLGVVKINKTFIMTNPNKVLKLMSKIIVIDVHFDPLSDAFIYTCYSPLFRKLKMPEKVPIYLVHFGKNNKIKFEEIRGGKENNNQTDKSSN